MEDGQESYSVLLGRLWFKQAKVHHNHGNSTLTIGSKDLVVTLSTIKKSNWLHQNNLNTFMWIQLEKRFVKQG
jgi:hypothetical protein